MKQIRKMNPILKSLSPWLPARRFSQTHIPVPDENNDRLLGILSCGKIPGILAMRSFSRNVPCYDLL
jgi:hypothetical protein